MNPSNLQDRIKYNKDVTTYSMNVDEVKNFPIKVSMKAIEILSENHRKQSGYFQLSDDLYQFLNDNESMYKQAMNEENPEFKKFSNIYFSYMNGSLYQNAEEIFNQVGRIYQLERYFDNLQPEKNIPQILYKVNKTSHEWELDVKNINELNDRFSKPIMLHTLVLFKDHLNYDHQIKNGTTNKPYTLSSNLIKSFYNNTTKSHEHLESFKEKDYFLTHFFNDAMKTVSSPKEILQFVIYSEEVRKMVEFDKAPQASPKKKAI